MFSPRKQYHPMLKSMLDEWVKFTPMKQEYLDFILHISILHEDRALCRYIIEKGANLSAPALKWYAPFLNNYISRD